MEARWASTSGGFPSMARSFARHSWRVACPTQSSGPPTGGRLIAVGDAAEDLQEIRHPLRVALDRELVHLPGRLQPARQQTNVLVRSEVQRHVRNADLTALDRDPSVSCHDRGG